MVLDWRKRASMVVNLLVYSKCEASMCFKVLVFGTKGKVRQDHFGGVREGTESVHMRTKRQKRR